MIDSHRDEIAKLEALYASNPEGRVFTHLAEACRKAGELERAREILDDGLTRHPDYASAHVVLGRVLLDAGDPVGSSAEFRRVLELDRHNLVALRSLGDLASKAGNAEEALYYYGELAVLDPSDLMIQEEQRRLRAQLESRDTALVDAEPAEPEPVSGRDFGFEGLVATAQAEAEEEARPPAKLAGLEASLVDGGERAEADDEADPGEDRTGLEFTDSATQPDSGDEAEADETSFADLDLDLDGLELSAETAARSDETAGSDSGHVSLLEDADEQDRGEAEPEDTGDRDASGESEDDAGDGRPADWHGMEGRWDAPAASAADADAERNRASAQDKGEWIPQDRWNWVSASAGEGADEESSQQEAEPDDASGDGWDGKDEAIDEPVEPPSWLDATPADTGSDDAPDFELGIEESEETFEAEVELHEESPARPVDSFEEGAQDVLQSAGLLDPDPDAGSDGLPAETDEEVPAAASAIADERGWDEPTDDDSGDQVITETLAEIYASQGLIERAVAVYQRLVRAYPADDRLHCRLAALQASAREGPGFEAEAEGEEQEAWLERVESAFTGGQGTVPEDATPYAWPTEEEPDDAAMGRAGDYFRSLLEWRPTSTPPASATEPFDAGARSPANWTSEPESIDASPVGETGGGESDQDLEMFRSWLKSLKK